jgi:hypothetical protein
MVIAPQQINGKLDRRDRAQLKQLEQQIDANLMDGKTMINVVGGLNPRVKTNIIQKYHQAGWEVQYLFDQKEGEYLCFTEQKEVRGFRQYGN